MFNLSNTILGTGIIAMPYVCRLNGCVWFVAMMLVCAVMSDFAVQLLFAAVDRVALGPGEQFSYAVLAEELFGWKLAIIAAWSVTLQQIGACIAYVVIIGDVLCPLVLLAYPPGDTSGLFAKRWTVQLAGAASGRVCEGSVPRRAACMRG